MEGGQEEGREGGREESVVLTNYVVLCINRTSIIR